MTVLFVLPQHHVLVLDGGYLPADVGPDLGAAHVQGDDGMLANGIKNIAKQWNEEHCNCSNSVSES